MPDDAKGICGFAVWEAQNGRRDSSVKTLSGFGSAGVLEVRASSSEGGTYRAVYTVKFSDAVYVLHCFQKKSTQGISTPKPDMELIRTRLKDAEDHYSKHYQALKKGRKL